MNKLLLDYLMKDYFTFIKDPDNLIKVNKIKKLLSNIENIKTGLTDYEIVKETPLYRLLHYKPITEQSIQISFINCLCINKQIIYFRFTAR